MPEIRRLWRCLLLPVVADLEQVLTWSHWHRCQQWVALHCHYRRQCDHHLVNYHCSY